MSLNKRSMECFKFLIHNDEFRNKLLPILEDFYFRTEDKYTEKAYKYFKEYVKRYKKSPSKADFTMFFENVADSQSDLEDVVTNLVYPLYTPLEDYNVDEFATDILENYKFHKKHYFWQKHIVEENPDLKKKWLRVINDTDSISFEVEETTDYKNNFKKIWEESRRTERKIPFMLELLNKATDGGVEPKTLNVVMAGTGKGKSTFLCHLAADGLRQGYNVLYITLEMACKDIAIKINANLFDMNIKSVKDIALNEFEHKIKPFLEKGNLDIKEIPTGKGTSEYIEKLMDDFEKNTGKPVDILLVDYINLMKSTKVGKDASSYKEVFEIAKELRGIGMNRDIPVWTATQTNRSGMDSENMNLGHVSESIGLPQTADFFLDMISTEKYEKLGVVVMKQEKNRFEDMNKCRKFALKIDRSKSRFYDTELTMAELKDD